MFSVDFFIDEYKKSLVEKIHLINSSDIADIIDVLEKTIETGSKIYVLGNGGSASTASHMVNDWGVGLRRRGIMNFDITSLADNTAAITAIANDIGYENIFYMQLEGLLTKENVLIAISCSGNSPNIIKAVEYAKEIGSTVIGVTGFDGGKLKELSNVGFHVSAPAGAYGIVEDAHMILDHMIYTYYTTKGK